MSHWKEALACIPENCEITDVQGSHSITSDALVHPTEPSASPQQNCAVPGPKVSTPLPSHRLWTIVTLAVIMVLVAVVRLRLAPAPLERDEGEYAFVGQLMLQGIPPYQEAANMKFPGTYASYAIIEAVFGQTANGIHHGLLVVNLATILLVYHLGRRFLGSRHEAVMAAGIYAVSSLSYSFLGPMAHATHFVVFFGLAGMALLISALGRNSLISFTLAGVITGFAYMAKQSGFYFVPLGCLLVLSKHDWRLLSRPVLRALAYFLAGAFAPFAFTVFVLQQLGCLDEFIFWTFRYASTYTASPKEGLEMLCEHLSFVFERGFPWAFFVIGSLLFLPWTRRLSGLSRRTIGLLGLFFVLSLAGVSLGLMFREHYWIMALPPVALLSAGTFSAVSTAFCHRVRPALVPLVTSLLCSFFCAVIVIREAPRFFLVSPAQNIWDIYQGFPFVEAITIGDYIREHTQAHDRIFVFGNEPEIYFYSRRRAATNNIFLYSLLERQPYVFQMERRVALDVERCCPRFFIEARYPLPPDVGEWNPLMEWKTRYLAEHYRLVFMIDHDIQRNRLIVRRSSSPASSVDGCYVIIWERKP
jgi:4-amino-4-deoxy-L-arabinose transferase-like glycosyltransferase